MIVVWHILFSLGSSGLLALAWIGAIDRADVRRARERAGTPMYVAPLPRATAREVRR